VGAPVEPQVAEVEGGAIDVDPAHTAYRGVPSPA
jgi:hypothetical protein